jgi:hypothetical protein
MRRNINIGCTGKLQVKFRVTLKKNQQPCACYITGQWNDKDMLIKLDNSKVIYKLTYKSSFMFCVTHALATWLLPPIGS